MIIRKRFQIFASTSRDCFQLLGFTFDRYNVALNETPLSVCLKIVFALKPLNLIFTQNR